MSVAFPSKTRGASAGRPKSTETAALESKKAFVDSKASPEATATVEKKKVETKTQAQPSDDKKGPTATNATAATEWKSDGKEAEKKAETAASEEEGGKKVEAKEPEQKSEKAEEEKSEAKEPEKKSPLSHRFNSAIKEGDDDIEAADETAPETEACEWESIFLPRSNKIRTWADIFDEPTAAFRSRKRKWHAIETYIDHDSEYGPEDEDMEAAEGTTTKEGGDGEPEAKKLKLSAKIDLEGFFLDADGNFREELMMTFLAANGGLDCGLEKDWNTGTYTALDMHNAVLSSDQVNALAWALSKGLPLTSLRLSFGHGNISANYHLIKSSVRGGCSINISS